MSRDENTSGKFLSRGDRLQSLCPLRPPTPIELAVLDMVRASPSPGKHAGMGAAIHIYKAWELRAIDPAMAAFRAITAEEEAATAIMHALKQRQYQRSDELKPREHASKLAVYPFTRAVESILALIHERAEVQVETGPEPAPTSTVKWKVPGVSAQLFVDKSGKTPRLMARTRLVLPNGEAVFATPEHPLEFNVRAEGAAGTHDFAKEMNSLASGASAKNIFEFIRRTANQRNEILYASSQGIPWVETPDGFLQEQQSRVFRKLSIYLMIAQTKHRQLFAQQALDAFLKIIAAKPSDLPE